MNTVYILIIWFGFSQSQTFDVSTYTSLAQCEAAKSVVTAELEKSSPFSYKSDNSVILCKKVESE